MVTGLITLATFALAFNWIVAVLLLGALFIHEFGHLLAYRLIGQPWGRMVFLPFLGGIAVPRIGFTTQGQTVFSALMGPAFSAIFAVIVTLIVWSEPGPSTDVWVAVGIVLCGLNLFNMLPVEPLDGGVALRYVLSSSLGRFAQAGHLLIGAAIIAAGHRDGAGAAAGVRGAGRSGEPPPTDDRSRNRAIEPPAGGDFGLCLHVDRGGLCGADPLSAGEGQHLMSYRQRIAEGS